MKNLFLVLCVFMFSLSACTQTGTSTIGNGKIDTLEMATIQIAVGLAMNQKPETVIPSYLVTNELLALDANKVASFDDYNLIVQKQIDSLNLDPMTKASALDLYMVVKEIIVSTLNKQGISEDQKYIVMMDIVKVINKSAKIRLQNVRSVKFDS